MTNSFTKLYAVVRQSHESSDIVIEDNLTKKEAKELQLSFDKRTRSDCNDNLPYWAEIIPQQRAG